MRLIISILLVTLEFYANACNCKNHTIDEYRDYNYFSSDVIFLAEIIESSERKTYVKIIEVFKGDVDSSLVTVFIEPCNITPIKGKRWLIYSNYGIKKTLIMNSCSLSRGFDYAYIKNFYTMPDPLPPNYSDKDEEIFNLKIETLNLKANIDLLEEINNLRYKKILDNSERSKYEFYKTKRYISVLYIISGILFIAIVFIFFIVKK